MSQSQSQIPGTTTDIQCPGPGLDVGQFDQPPLPITMKPKALEIIDQVVPPCDGRKELVDLRRALLPGNKIGIGHADCPPLCVRKVRMGTKKCIARRAEPCYNLRYWLIRTMNTWPQPTPQTRDALPATL